MPLEGDWPEAPRRASADGVARRRSTRSKRRIARWSPRSASLPEDALFKPTNDPRDRRRGAGVSYYVLLHGIVQHDVYHCRSDCAAEEGALIRTAAPRTATPRYQCVIAYSSTLIPNA